MKKTEVVYMRVSTKQQRRGNKSLKMQLEACKQFAKQKGLTITRHVHEKHKKR